MLMALNMTQAETERKRGDQGREDPTKPKEAKRTSARGLTVRRDANSVKKKNVITNTPARDAEKTDMESPTAMQKSTKAVTNSMVPKYLHYSIWDPKSNFSPNTSNWTEKAEPLAGPLPFELQDDVVNKTIKENPHLFHIITPIQVGIFESYLSTHPNKLLSIQCVGDYVKDFGHGHQC